ncbi:DUF3365 domain-containing protein [Sulfurovum sp. zt1-1]|uniref:DUF3365 domain-containing protein n=1 Tax=Sulfurovum zhangzhouensis TaxID=3019067 RepID=A0ABT7QXI5_9BACT|nr:DUF3365 domain-containing protein [Sulfurovum zhangzhouensis]MDM5271545.1 DUF3365 domain-containing protein [Sulfurovum zhangzhouensis]
MKFPTLLLSTLLTTSLYAVDQNASSEQMNVKMEGIGYIKKLGGTLKSELQKHMQVDPTGVAAFGFCTAKAMEITEEVNKELPANAKVRRTALKTRNEMNMPDATDIAVMESYLKAIEEKRFTPQDIKIVEEGNTTRVYKPLLTDGVCLKCHGQNVSTEIQEMIITSYPKDEAMGFKEGDLRGVVVAEIIKKSDK